MVTGHQACQAMRGAASDGGCGELFAGWPEGESVVCVIV